MKVNVFLTLIIALITTTIHAQNDFAVDNDELERYAIMMDSVDQMRVKLVAELTDMVRNNENITVERYNQLYKISDDESKLATANATPQELKALNEVLAKKKSGTAHINETFKNLAKDYVGASSYNKIRKALTADAEVKTRYQNLFNKLKADNGG